MNIAHDVSWLQDKFTSIRVTQRLLDQVEREPGERCTSDSGPH